MGHHHLSRISSDSLAVPILQVREQVAIGLASALAFTELTILLEDGGEAISQLLTGTLHQQCKVLNQVFIFAHSPGTLSAGQSLHPTNTGGNTALTGDHHRTDFAGVGTMDTPTKLDGKIADLNHAYPVTILLTEESHRSAILRFVDGNIVMNGDLLIEKDPVLDLAFHLFQLLW